MDASESQRLGERLVESLDLWEFGVELTAARLRREDPDAEPDEIERRIVAWLRTRPGAEDGDAVGRPRSIHG